MNLILHYTSNILVLICWLIRSKLLGVAGKVTYDTGLGLILEWFYRGRILSKKARSKV